MDDIDSTVDKIKNLISSLQGEVDLKYNFYDVMYKHKEIQPSMLDAAYNFTEKYEPSSAETKKVEELLLHNIDVFTALKLGADDINHITKHCNSYNLQSKW
ncbi:MAG: hypothetical protein PG981_000380 [Wolbachia endosymbiont of Ctenocephalides orientis wCori]|nr:MAG: hypothetical protein PG981_000380 [Wolbachia endosymbiont of Ctenocephalides orientis wCori]